MRSALTPHIRLRSQAYLILRAVECLTIVAIRGYFLTSRTHRNTSVLPVYAVSGAGGLILSSALWTSRLVPRTVSMLGLLGYPVFLVGTVLAMFGLIHVTHGAGMDALVPVASSSRSSRSGSSPKDSPPRGSQMMGPRTVRSTRQPRLTLSLPERLGASGPNPSHESASPRSLGERKPPFRVASVCLHEVVDREAGRRSRFAVVTRLSWSCTSHLLADLRARTWLEASSASRATAETPDPRRLSHKRGSL